MSNEKLLNSSTKRPRTLSIPTSDHDLPPRPFSRETSMVQDKCRSTAPPRLARPQPGMQWHEFESQKHKTDVAQASGVSHYLVPIDWYQMFIAYVRDGSGLEPSELDLGELDKLKDDDGEFRADLRIGLDVQVLLAAQWSKLQLWYGQEDEYVARHSYKVPDGNYVIEFKPTDFYFSLYTPPNSFTELKKLSMYKYKDVEGLYEKVRHAFDIGPSQQLRFWHTTKSDGLTNLNDATEAIANSHDRLSIGTVADNATSFIVETRQGSHEKWQLETCKKAQIARSRPLGTKGLSNLGNTCYMASALQCLSHVKELYEYFIAGTHLAELNDDNPLGYGGRVATAFAKLLAQLFADDVSKAVAPRELKTVLGNINQSFGGYQQQDSQELLAFLLDALHEDLNRIVKKPATERPDIGDVNDDDLLKHGEEAWRIHKLRNDSVIVDLFQGMYKSTLVCPVCAHVSITFDPFSDLSLPLPFRSYWWHDIYYVPLNGSIVKQTIEFEQNASIGQIVSYLSKRFDVPTNRIAGAEVWKHKFYKIYESYMPVSTIEKDDEAYFYELSSPDPRTDKDSKDIWVPVYTFKKSRYGGKPEDCALPFPIILSPAEAKSYEMIQQKLLSNYSRFTTSTDLATSSPSVEALHPERMRISNDDVLDPEASAIGLSHTTISHGQSPPFDIKVNQHRIAGSFYGGKDPMLLSDRIPKSSSPTMLSQQVSRISSPGGPPQYTDSYPISDGDTGEDAPRSKSVIVEDPGSWFDRFNGPEMNKSPVDIDIDMKDDSDDEAARPNTDLVDKFLHYHDRDAAIGSIPTPDSSPVIPVANLGNSPDSLSKDVALLASEDALLCEWPESIYDELFSKDAETIGGRSKWDDFESQQDEDMLAQREAREKSKNNLKSLEDCLDEFSKEEPLDADNTWYCPKCKEHQRANKTFELWRSGDILVFHLKRFSNSRSLSDKIDAEIQFPVRGLNLENRLGERKLKARKGRADLEDSVYDLTGVVNHYGGLGGGHYTAFAQTFDTESYRDFHNFNGTLLNAPILLLTD